MLAGLLAAGGAATVAAFLPEKWTRPVVQTGVLPVHAQASGLTGAIDGTFLFNNEPIEGITIGCFSIPIIDRKPGPRSDPAPVKVQETLTDASGFFTFTGLTPGIYDVGFLGKGSWYYRSDLLGGSCYITVLAGRTANGDFGFPGQQGVTSASRCG